MTRSSRRRAAAQRQLRAAADVPGEVNAVRNPYLPRDNEVWCQLHATPEDFVHDSFQTADLEEGVREITGELHATGERVTCAYCFESPGFDVAKAQGWLSEKGLTAAKLDPAKDTTYKQITAKASAVFPCSPARMRAEGKKLPTITIDPLYSGGPVQPDGWPVPMVAEISGIRMAKGRDQSPILKDHSPDLVVGHGWPTIGADSVTFTGPVSGKGEAAREVLEAAKDGLEWQASIGLDLETDADKAAVRYFDKGETLIANGRTFRGPLIYWPQSVFNHAAITGRGADPTTHVSLAAKASSPIRSPKMDEQLAAFVADLGLDPLKISDAQKTKLTAAYNAQSAAATVQADVNAAIAAGKKAFGAQMAAEMSRLNTLQASYKGVCTSWCMDLPEHVEKRKKADELRAKATAEPDAWSSDKIELEFLRLGRPDNVISNTRGPGAEFDATVLEAAACRSLMMPEKTMEKHFRPEVMEASARREFRNIGLKALLAMGGRARGFNAPLGTWDDATIRDALVCAFPSPHTMRAEASTFQLPGLTSNLANKYLYEGFWMVDDAWSKIAAKRSAPDFKPVPGFRIYGNTTFEKVGPNGEIAHGDLGELVYVNAAETYAKAIVVTRQHIRNDDLSALSRIPQILGQGAAYALNHAFWTVFLAGKDSQGGTVFSATHTTAGNKGNSNYQNGSTSANGITQSTSALSTTSLAAVRQLFREQIKPDGEPLGFPPKVLLVPPSLETMAEQIYKSIELRQAVTALGATNSAATTEVQTTNIWKGQFEPITTPYIGATDYPAGATAGSDASWYLLADPSQLPLMEIVFLDGQQTPTVQSAEADFDILGIAHRGFFDFGVKMIEYRAGVKASGA